MWNWMRRRLGHEGEEALTVLEQGRFGEECWEISAETTALPAFLHALPLLVPPEAVLVLEGGPASPEVRGRLAEVAVPPVARVARGTLWPRSSWTCLSAAPEALEALVARLEGLPDASAFDLCSHLHVVTERQLLLRWYDAFLQPAEVSIEVPETKVVAFAGALGVPWRRWVSGLDSED